MGQSTSYKEHFGEPKISLILEKNHFFTGEIINGSIFIKSGNFLKKGIINYKLFNKEMYSYKDKQINTESNKENLIFEKSLVYRQLIDYSLTREKKIPFKLLIPKNILSNFEYFLGKNKHGFLRNFLQVDIPEIDLKIQKFIIIMKPFNLLELSLSFNAVQYLNLLGIINKGNLSLSASYKKNCFRFFEKIPIEINIENNSNSSIDILKIDVKLLRDIIFKSQNEDKDLNFKDILYEEILTIDRTLENENKNFKVNTELTLEEPESLFNKYIIDSIYYNNLYIRDKSNFIKLIPDIDSKLIKCRYIITIECIFKYFLKIESFSLNMPVYVYHYAQDISDDENNKEKILNSNVKSEKKEDKTEKENKLSKHIEKIKELSIYTNLGNDDWNTPTKEGINSKE